MHFKIDAETRRGLRIIGEIPDLPLGKVSGYNGIGKTNAIKILSLCVGEQPFKGDSASWRSFRDHLHRATIEVRGLDGANSVQWTLDPRNWPDNAEPLQEQLGTLRIDGRIANHAEIPSLLSVHHILVAETPLELLKGRVNSARRDVTSWIESVGDARSRGLDVKLRDLHRYLTSLLPAQIHLDLTASKEAAKVAQDLESQLLEVKEQVRLLHAAADVSDRLGQVRGRGPELDTKLAKLRGDMESIEARTADLDQQITEASTRQHRDKKAEREFELARKYLIGKEKAAREVAQHFDRLIAAAGVPADFAGLEAEQEALGQLLQSLVDRLPQVHATPMLIATLEGVADRLIEAERHELGDSVLVEPCGDKVGWTVRELREACLNRVKELSKKTPSADAQALSNQISETRNRIDALARAGAVMQQLENVRIEHERAEGRLRNATNALPRKAAQTLDELMVQRRRLDDKSRSIQAEHSRLTHARELLGGGSTEEALTSQLFDLCKAAGVDAARVRGRLEQSRHSLDDITRRHALAVQTAERTERTSESRVQALGTAVADLATSPGTAWLRRAIPSVSTLALHPPTEQAAALEHIRRRLETARTELSDSINSVRAIGKAFANLHNWLNRIEFEDNAPNEFDIAARLWLANQVRQWFQDPLISEALFDKGVDVRLDWKDLTVRWNVGDEPRSKPLTQFSSGEQAFAYTHAQLAQLERSDTGAANRLIALDEFSSFLDARRMEKLIGYLADRHVRVPRDQVLVILPLESLVQLESKADENGLTRIRRLERHGYVSEPLVV
jgi:hypothetical protein